MARALTWVMVLGVMYASLYPFTGWRDSGWQLGAWFFSPWPKYWTRGDLWLNWLGYLPLGFLWAWRHMRASRRWSAVLLAVVQVSSLSLALEAAQGFIDTRVSSNVDWAFNTLGGITGALLSLLLRNVQKVSRWRRSGDKWLQPNSDVPAVLLMLWVLALCVPSALPFALGRWPGDEWWTWLLSQLPQAWTASGIERFSLTRNQEAVLTALALLSPLTLINFMIKGRWNRLWVGLGVLAMALLVPTLLMVWIHGPEYAGSWLLPSTPLALLIAVVGGGVVLTVPQRWRSALAWPVLVAHVVGVNSYAHTGYWDIEWQAFIQGQSARVYGALAWVSLLWPWAVMALLAASQARRPTKNVT